MLFIESMRFAYLSLALSASLAAACTDDVADDGPVLPSTDTQPPSSPTAPARITSTVCVLADLTDQSACSTGGASGLTVTAGGVATTTDADGSFDLELPPGTLTSDVTVTGAGITPTTLPVDIVAGSDLVPAIDDEIYQQMLVNTGLQLGAGTGAIVTTLGVDGSPVNEFGISANPAAPYGAYFQSTSPVNWSTDGNGQRGVAWIPGLVSGTYDLTYDRIAGGLETQVGGVQVRNGGVTILNTALVSSPSNL